MLKANVDVNVREHNRGLVDREVYVNESSKPLVLMVGAGFGGIQFIKSVVGSNCEVLIVDQNNYHQFQPLLYQVAISGLEPDSIVAPIRKLFSQKKNVRYKMGRLLKVDSNKQIAYFNIGYVKYDRLILGLGSQTNYFGNNSIKKHAIGLKSINDALNLRSWILQRFEQATNPEDQNGLLHFVIAGGGPAGIEMAGALAEFKLRLLKQDYPEIDPNRVKISLLEGGPSILSSMSKRAQRSAIKVLSKLGVDVHLNARVLDYDGSLVQYEQNQENHRIKSSTLIWTAGVICHKIEGLPDKVFGHGNRIYVNEQLQVMGLDNIYVLGDQALVQSKSTPHGHPMVAQVAIQQAKYLAKHLLKRDDSKFVYKDKGSMATIGKKNAVADINHIFLRGNIGWLLWSFVHIVQITGFKGKLQVALNWLLKYIRYEKANQLIIRKYDPLGKWNSQ
ncbi:MAG: NAD(P)/FAD-dependent oxidoreductase [Bacteroidia bacterium]